MTSARLKVCTSVDRTLIFLTNPSVLPVEIQSPVLMGRSSSRMMPETKLLTMFCRPNPMPTDSAPATMAMLVKLTPTTDRPASAATMNPT